ncbi:MAG TPA: hypothetical protein ENG73_11885 [Desulfobacterales bacterium]|nr:hypothetical protein [Desulfobacterales bacterium]
MNSTYLEKFDPLQPSELPDSSEVFYCHLEGKVEDSEIPMEKIWYPSEGSVHGQLSKDTEETGLSPDDSELLETHFTKKQLAPVLHLRKVPTIQSRFLSLQKWEGIVFKVLEDSFIARLTDLTEKGPDEEAEFAIDEVHEEDRSLIKEGAIFYWSIGYLETGGQRRRVSDIRFRRLPRWESKEIESARKEANRLRDILEWE